jgi:hypothetical protein
MNEAAPYVAPYLSMLPPNARLLVQAGATDGGLARKYLKTYPAASVLVVDADAARAQQARLYASRVYRQLEWADGWFFDTTLEQLENPLRVLQQVRKVIQFDACIVARIANYRYWNAPVDAPRHCMEVAAMLALFEQSGFRVADGVLLNPSTLPADIEAATRDQAAQANVDPEALLQAILPSHYLIKAVPA